MSKVRLLVELDVKPDQVDTFVEMFIAEFASRSRSEDGCEFYEIWSGQAVLDVHMAQDWFGEWAPKMDAMQAMPLVVHVLTSVEDLNGCTLKGAAKKN